MIKEKIYAFFAEKGKAEGLRDDTDLFRDGFIDSLFALEMVLYLENTFRIRLKNEDISQESFRTVNDIASVVERTQGAAPAERAPRRRRDK